MRNCKLNENGNNANIKISLLPEQEMRSLGFTDRREGYWYLHKNLGHNISFNLSVAKENTEDWRIDVLDELFLQPYDYQFLMAEGIVNNVAKDVKAKVEQLMQMLVEKGIVTGYNKGDYI